MECGRYKVIDDIHIYSCDLGQLKIPKGKIVELEEHGFLGCTDGIKFPGRMLDFCRSQLQRIY